MEEYYWNGTWDMETLALDLELLQAHHRQALSPELPPLEDIPEVVLPEPTGAAPQSRKTAESSPAQAAANGAAEKARHDGSLLFRQFKRYFQGAYLEEYYWNGTWDMETLALDLELLKAHHRQAKEPPLPFLEDIPEVVLPEPIEVVPPWRKVESSPTQTSPNGIKLNPAATAAAAAAAGRGSKRPSASISQTVGTKGKGEQLAGKGKVVSSKGVQLAGKGKVVPAKAAQNLGKGKKALGQAIGKGEQPPANGSQLLAKGAKPIGKASGKSVQLPGTDGEALVGKGTKSVAKAIGGLKGSQKGVPGAPAFSKATQLLDTAAPNGKGKGKRVQYVKSGAVERFKAMQGQSGSSPFSNSKASSPASAYAKSKAISPGFANSKASSPAFTKAGAPNRPRIILSKFAKRAANRVTMSKEVKEQFLDADDLD